MTPIAFTYEVVSVDEAAKSMEVIYRSEGFTDVLVGMPLPSEGEILDEVVDAYAPINEWKTELRVVSPITVGTSGSSSTIIDITNISESPRVENYEVII